MCRNVTDVDDVLDAAAARSGARPDSFAAVQQFRFDRDMAALGVRRPTHEPRAHNHVGQVVTLAAALLELGAAYRRDGIGLVPRGRGRRAGRAGPATRRRRWRPSSGAVPDAAADDPADVPVWRAARGPARRPGRVRGATAGRAGTPSAPRWR